MHSVAFSEANGLIASGSKDRTVRLWLPTACVPASDGRRRGALARSLPR